MPHEDAATRARSGRVTEVHTTFERPETVVRSSKGELFALPRRQAPVPIYRKTNARLIDPATGERRRFGRRTASRTPPKPMLSFTTFALTAFVGFKAVQTLWRLFKGRQQQADAELEDEEELEYGQQYALPPPQVAGPSSSLLRRALPTLGPPRRTKALAAQQRAERAAGAAAALRAATGSRTGGRAAGRQRLLQPVQQRRQGMLSKWEAVLKQQAAAAHQQQQQQQQQHLALPGPKAVSTAQLEGNSSSSSSKLTGGAAAAALPSGVAAPSTPPPRKPLLQLAATQP